MRILVVILLGLVLSGCYPQHWVKPNMTSDQYNKDYYECTSQAGAESWGGNPLILDQQRASCMQTRGYHGTY